MGSHYCYGIPYVVSIEEWFGIQPVLGGVELILKKVKWI